MQSKNVEISCSMMFVNLPHPIGVVTSNKKQLIMKSHAMSSLKRNVSENDLKQFVEATLQEYGTGITKMMTIKTLHQVSFCILSRLHI